METCFADTPRIKDKPFSKRVGNNLLTRNNNGHVNLSVGYFLSSQILCRKILVKKLINIFRERRIQL